MSEVSKQTYLDLGMWLTNPENHSEQQLQRLLAEQSQLSLISLVNAHWLAGALTHSVKNSKVWHRLDTDLQDYLVELELFFAERAKQIKNETIFACQLLQQANIDVIVLKGSANLFNGVANPNSTRFMTDIDLLVPEDKQQQAISTLKRHGYETEADEFDIFAKEHHHAPPLCRKGSKCSIELHRWLLKKAESDVLSTQEAWHHAIPLTLTNALTVKQLAENHQVVLSIAHSELAHASYQERELDLRQLLNLWQIINRYSASLNWQQIEHHFSRCNKQYALYASLFSINTLFNSKIEIPKAHRNGAETHFKKCLSKKRANQFLYFVAKHLKGYKKDTILMTYGREGRWPTITGRAKHLKRHLIMLTRPEYLKRFWQRVR